ncbi:MAG: hypothetical protein GXO65_07820, partial [Euryarchaeota archaeon]|nr:hypothetical protein [Euryarchaeota archaeon]
MNVIAIVDAVSAAAFGAGLLFVVLTPSRVLDKPTKVLFSVSLAIYFIVCLTNVLEHGGISGSFKRYVDYGEMLFLPFLIFSMYSYTMGCEIRRRKKAERALKRYARELEESNRLKGLFADIMRHDL